MKYCTRCLYPANHPLHITFDEEGVCSGCRVHEEKDELNWKSREQKLQRILERYRGINGSRNYDCVVPVCGAKDSYFIVHTIKNIYGMNPLLVAFNKQYNTKRGIRNLEYLRTIFDCDLMTSTIDPQLAKRLVRSSLKKMGSIYWHNHAGGTTFPVQVAVRFQIPLVIWGVHQGCDQVGMFSHLDEVEMTRKYRIEHDLMGFGAKDMIDEAEGLTERVMQRFKYPSDKEIERVGLRGIYLSNYIRWDSKKQHELMIELYGYETAKQHRTFNTYEDVDCFLYSDVHDYIKFLKYGYGKVTDHAAREIRLKRMTREEGIELVSRYQTNSPKYLPLFLKWAEMTEREFYEAVDQFRDLAIWFRDVDRNWKLDDSVINHKDDPGVDRACLEKKENCNFLITPTRDPQSVEDDFVLMMRGFVDQEW